MSVTAPEFDAGTADAVTADAGRWAVPGTVSVNAVRAGRTMGVRTEIGVDLVHLLSGLDEALVRQAADRSWSLTTCQELDRMAQAWVERVAAGGEPTFDARAADDIADALAHARSKDRSYTVTVWAHTLPAMNWLLGRRYASAVTLMLHASSPDRRQWADYNCGVAASVLGETRGLLAEEEMVALETVVGDARAVDDAWAAAGSVGGKSGQTQMAQMAFGPGGRTGLPWQAGISRERAGAYLAAGISAVEARAWEEGGVDDAVLVALAGLVR